MEIFEDDDSTKQDGSFLCHSEFELNFGAAEDKEICIPWLCVCIDSRYVVGDVIVFPYPTWRERKAGIFIERGWAQAVPDQSSKQT